MQKEISPSRQLAIKSYTQIFKILKDSGGGMRRKELFEKLAKQVEFNEWETFVNNNGNSKRWENITSYYSIPLSKAGFLVKTKGFWTTTPEGETALKKGTSQMINDAIDLYRTWDKKRDKKLVVDDREDSALELEEVAEISLEEYEEKATEGIREFLSAKNPYEFQDCVAALLNAMGYHISFIALPGKDGGIDIIAYNDPLGTRPPRIVVQVKHRPESNISSDEIQKLVGTMRRDSDVGIFVTSGEFSNPSKIEARQSGKHVELIGFTRFVELWIQYYEKMNDEQKSMLPLQAVYFLRMTEN